MCRTHLQAPWSDLRRLRHAHAWLGSQQSASPAPCAGKTICSASRVDLGGLAVRPLSCFLGWHALYRLRVHVGDDVLGHHLGSPTVRRACVPREPAVGWYVAERPQYRIDLPQLVVLPLLCGTIAVTLLRGEPLIVDRPRVHPAQEILRSPLVFRVAHEHVGERCRKGELATGALGNARMPDVLPHR